MKIAITGHTRGIGKAIADALSEHEVIGLSRSNGYDISDTATIIKSIEKVDVFINNAYFEYAQCELLTSLHHLWKGTDKMIINIGSIVTDYPRIDAHLDHLQWDYRDHKTKLRDVFRKLIKTKNTCNLVLISPGATDTDMIKHQTVAKLNPNEVAKAVQYVIANPLIKELTLYEK